MSGGTGYRLHLGHRYSTASAHCPSESNSPVQIYRDWELLQTFMDISKPLSEVPELEPFRTKDPVTVNYDKEHQRPPRYWQNMDPAKAKQFHKEASEATYKYPWGKTREQALAAGWQPSSWSTADYQVEGEIGSKALLKPPEPPTREELMAQKLGN
jgi:hypothetical protein